MVGVEQLVVLFQSLDARMSDLGGNVVGVFCELTISQVRGGRSSGVSEYR